MIEIIRAAFSAGEIKTFLIQGEYLEILEAAYPVDVAMMDRSGAQLSTMRNAEASYFSRPGKYEVIQVTSASAQTVRLFVGSGDAGTRRTSGIVTVVDDTKSRSANGKAFAATSIKTPAAGQINQIAIHNPLGSGVVCVVNKLRVSSATAQAIYVVGGNGIPAGVPVNSASKNVNSGSVSASKKYDGEIAAAGFGVGVDVIFAVNCPVNTVVSVELSEPLVIQPGKFMAFQTSVAQTNIDCSMQFYEE